MRQNTGVARGARIAVRLSREDRSRIDELVKARGYTNPKRVHQGGNPERTQRPARAPGYRTCQRPVPPADEDRRSNHVRQRTRRPAGSGGAWHELMTSGKSGCDRRSLVARRTSALHGLADSSCSCTTRAAREKPATAAPPAEKGEARVRTCSVAPLG